MEEYREQVSTVFYKYDTEGTGLLTQPELLKVVKDLGKTISNYEFKSIFKKIDTDKDGKVKLDDFLAYWYYGHVLGVQDLLFFKMKAQKTLNKIDKKLENVGSVMGEKTEIENCENKIGVFVGENPNKSQIGAKVLFGKQATQHSEEICQGFEQITPNSPALVLKIKVKDSEQAKEQFQDLFEQILALAESLLPPEIADKYMEAIKIDYANPDPNYVTIGISGEHELVDELIEQFKELVVKYVPEESLASLDLNISLGYTIKDILADKSKQTSELVNNLQVSVEGNLKINKGLLNGFKDQLINKYNQLIEQNKFTAKHKQASYFFPLFLIAGSHVILKFKNLDNVLNEPELPVGDAMPETIGDMLEFAQEHCEENKEAITEFPIFEEVQALFKDHCEANLQITVQAPQGAVIIQAVTEGITELQDIFLSEA